MKTLTEIAKSALQDGGDSPFLNSSTNDRAHRVGLYFRERLPMMRADAFEVWSGRGHKMNVRPFGGHVYVMDFGPNENNPTCNPPADVRPLF